MLNTSIVVTAGTSSSAEMKLIFALFVDKGNNNQKWFTAKIADTKPVEKRSLFDNFLR